MHVVCISVRLHNAICHVGHVSQLDMIKGALPLLPEGGGREKTWGRGTKDLLLGQSSCAGGSNLYGVLNAIKGW